LRLQELCKTTRRAAGSGLPRLFPRVLGDDRLDARLGIAIRFFETHLGRSRGELDAEALVALFGDPKLARGLLRCLARSYRYRSRPLAEVLGTERAAALTARGQGTPRDLRALAYRRANQAGGFVSPAQRVDFLRHLSADLEPAELEQVLWLDAPEQAVLVRQGPVPTPADIRACYNVQVLETLLSTAPEPRFALQGTPAEVQAVAARHGVQVSLTGLTVTLYGRPDAAGVWTHHGARVARTALILLSSGALGPGVATVQLGERQYAVRLDATLLGKTLPPHCWAAPPSTWGVVETVVRALQTLRRCGRLAGWRLRWWPEPLVAAQGLLWPELMLRRGTTSLALLPLSGAQLVAEAAVLGALARRLSCLLLAPAEGPDDFPTDPQVIPWGDAHLAQRLAACLERSGAGEAPSALPAGLVPVLDAARAAGALAEAALARRLDCVEEDVHDRLTPALHTASDLVYIDGFGLCTAPWLAHVRTLIDAETAGNQGRLELARLGRQLRRLVGHNEGLHALIAHLSGELRPVAGAAAAASQENISVW
jgi:hypothetical protein